MTEYFRRLETADGLYHDTRITEEEFYRPRPKVETVCQSSNPFDALLMREPLAEVTFESRTYEYRETMQRGNIKMVRYVERYKPQGFKRSEVMYAYSFSSDYGIDEETCSIVDDLKWKLLKELLYGCHPLPLKPIRLRCTATRDGISQQDENDLAFYVYTEGLPESEYDALASRFSTRKELYDYISSLPRPWEDPEFKKKVCINKEKGDETATTK